jgi:hypothetical protein
MRFELEDFEGNEILPLIDPPIEKLRGIRLHKLVTVISIFLYPTIDIKQAVREHSSFLTEAVVHSCFAPGSECLDDHVSHAFMRSELPSNETQDQPRLREAQVAPASISAPTTTPAKARLAQSGCIPLTRMYVGRIARATEIAKAFFRLSALAAMPCFTSRAAIAQMMSGSDCA